MSKKPFVYFAENGSITKPLFEIEVAWLGLFLKNKQPTVFLLVSISLSLTLLVFSAFLNISLKSIDQVPQVTKHSICANLQIFADQTELKLDFPKLFPCQGIVLACLKTFFLSFLDLSVALCSIVLAVYFSLFFLKKLSTDLVIKL